MARILISLVGGRPLPNILVALHLKADSLYFIASKDSVGEGGNYQKAVDALPSNLKPIKSYFVEPYSIQSTKDACQNIVNKCAANDEIIVNSASEPKIMAFGAYDITKQLRTENKNRQIDLCYLGTDGLFWIFKDNKEPVTIDIKTYFSSYGWNIKHKDIIEKIIDTKKLEQLSLLFIEHEQIHIYQRLLKSIRKKSEGKGKRTCKSEKCLSDEEFNLFKKIEEIGIVSNLKRSDNGTSWTINSQEDGEILLGGEWLEYYVYRKASTLVNNKGKRIFQECLWGAEDISGKGEIDFVGIRGGQIVICSCKTENGINKKMFEDLHSKAEQLGKGMCSSLLISTVLKTTRKDIDLQRYNRWAKERRVILILAEDILKIDLILRKVILAEKDAEPHEVPYYPRI